MRKPWTLLGLVDPEPRQPPVNVFRDSRRMPAPILEDEHSDRARLPVPSRDEHGPLSAFAPFTQRSGNRVDLTGRSRAEERDRDVQVLFGDKTGLFGGAELLPLPAGDAVRG